MSGFFNTLSTLCLAIFLFGYQPEIPEALWVMGFGFFLGLSAFLLREDD
jgi:hypothetical protein